MPRANRYFVEGQVYHLTHRCHDSLFLLKFARERTSYREKLRKALDETKVSLLDYCVTSNHVHLIVSSEIPEKISRCMQQVAGETAQAYNRRKERRGAFWEDRYHATMVEPGEHLMRCLIYIALQMVRCGEVRHPSEWEWAGYHELCGSRQRYRMLDDECLFKALGVVSQAEFRRWYEATLQERIADGKLQREAQWTESIGVGSEAFVRGVAERIEGRQRLQISNSAGAWIIQETSVA